MLLLINTHVRYYCTVYSGRKITESLGNVAERGEKDGKSKGGARLSTACLSMYSITENIYCSQLSSVVILLQPEPVSHSIIQGKDWVFTPSVISSFGLPLPPTCLVLTVKEARSYFASTLHTRYDTHMHHEPRGLFYTVKIYQHDGRQKRAM
jgi:hypothetical protein